MQIVLRLNKGLGISLVDRTPEELVYIMFRDVAVEYVQENEEQTLRADVHSLQVSLLRTHGDHRLGNTHAHNFAHYYSLSVLIGKSCIIDVT